MFLFFIDPKIPFIFLPFIYIILGNRLYNPFTVIVIIRKCHLCPSLMFLVKKPPANLQY